MRNDLETEYRVDGRSGHLILTSTLDLRSMLESQLVGFVNPRWQETEDKEGATKCLAQSLSSVPQIAAAILSHMLYGCTEDGDSFESVVLLELRRRMAAGMGPEGEMAKDLAEQLGKAKARIEVQEEAIRDLKYDLSQAKATIQSIDMSRNAANGRAKELQDQLLNALAEIRRLNAATTDEEIKAF